MEDLTTPERLLSAFHQSKLEKWWCQFNIFEWPEDFPVLKPEGWETQSRYDKMQGKVAKECWEALVKLTTQSGRLKMWNGEFRQLRLSA